MPQNIEINVAEISTHQIILLQQDFWINLSFCN